METVAVQQQQHSANNGKVSIFRIATRHVTHQAPCVGRAFRPIYTAHQHQHNGNIPWDKIEQVSIFASISIAISIPSPVLNMGKSIGVCTLSVGIDAQCELPLGAQIRLNADCRCSGEQRAAGVRGAGVADHRAAAAAPDRRADQQAAPLLPPPQRLVRRQA